MFYDCGVAPPIKAENGESLREDTHLNRITQLDPTQALGNTKQLFDRVQAKLGTVPNFFRVLGNSPAALEGYLNFSGALATGNFDVKVREQIALTVAESNLCGYCLSAHTFTGDKVGLSEKEIADAIHATATIGKIDAALKLARGIVVQRGEVRDSDLERARIFGLTDGEIVETVANVVLNILTNYVNHVARTLVDFPEVRPGQI
jgi:AhpD family alkylhydroperoxidase